MQHINQIVKKKTEELYKEAYDKAEAQGWAHPEKFAEYLSSVYLDGYHDGRRDIWIPVKEMLPPKNKHVVVRTLKNGKLKSIFTTFINDGGRWEVWDRRERVTHWMPVYQPMEEDPIYIEEIVKEEDVPDFPS